MQYLYVILCLLIIGNDIVYSDKWKADLSIASVVILALKGKTVSINGDNDEVADALKNILKENGARIVFESDADIIVNVK